MTDPQIWTSPFINAGPALWLKISRPTFSVQAARAKICREGRSNVHRQNQLICFNFFCSISSGESLFCTFSLNVMCNFEGKQHLIKLCFIICSALAESNNCKSCFDKAFIPHIPHILAHETFKWPASVDKLHYSTVESRLPLFLTPNHCLLFKP